MHWHLITDRDPGGCADLGDRGLHYGDGLFETMLQSGQHILYWNGHYRRLSRDAARLGIACPPKGVLLDALQPSLDEGGQRIIKLILTRGSDGRGPYWPQRQTACIYLLHSEYIPDKQEVTAGFSKHSLPENPPLAGIKHLNRLDYILASRELAGREDCDQLILLDRAGRVIETLVHNLFLVRDGRVSTPSLQRCGVAGVMREQVIKSLERMGKAVRIDDCSRNDLLTADELFVCNSVQGIRALTRIDGREFPAGPLTQELQRLFNEH